MLEAGAPKIVIGPTSNVLDALKGATFTEPRILRKPGGQEITTRLVVKGAGMVGLQSKGENQEWAGIFNHIVKTAGASFEIGRLLQLNGQGVNLQLMLDTVMVSHGGRRQLDEANWYPNEIQGAEGKKAMGDTPIGLEILKERQLPEELIDMVAFHAMGLLIPFAASKNWNEKLPLYLDYRIGQDAVTLEERFNQLQLGVAAGRFTQDWWLEAYAWASATQVELFAALNLPSYGTLVKNPQNLIARSEVAIKLGKFSEKEAKDLQETKVYKESGREVKVAKAVGLSEEEFLARLQLHPVDINDRFLQPERWERYLRRLYINDVEKQIFGNIGAGNIDPEKTEGEFPHNTWWGKYCQELYNQNNGVAYHSLLGKQRGVIRAIEFYRQIEQRRLESTKELSQ